MAKEDEIIAFLQASQKTLLRSLARDPVFMTWTETFNESSQNLFIEFSKNMLFYLKKATRQDFFLASKKGESTVQYRIRPAHETFEFALKNIDTHPDFMRAFLKNNADIEKYLSDNIPFLKEVVELFNDYLEHLKEDTSTHDLYKLSEKDQVPADLEAIKIIIQKLDEYKELMYDLKHLFQRSRIFTDEQSAIAKYNDLWSSSELYKWCRTKFNKKVTIEAFHRALFDAIIKDSDPNLNYTKAYVPFTNALSRYIGYNLNTHKVQLENSAALEKYLSEHPHVVEFLIHNLDKLQKCNVAFKKYLLKKSSEEKSKKEKIDNPETHKTSGSFTSKKPRN